MSDAFYNTTVLLGRFPLWVSSSPLVLHRDCVPRTGAFILASNHNSVYDIPLLMRHTPRKLDFVSVTEYFARPFVGWFFRNMNALALERNQSDPKTVRNILDRLLQGRVVAVFPEGRIRPENESVVCGAAFRPGVAGVARLAKVPIVPAVVLRSSEYQHFRSWLPLKRTRYGVAFGNPIVVKEEADAEAQLAEAYRDLFAELTQSLDKSRSV